MFLSVGFCNVPASSPPWGGDGHYTFGDEDDPFAESYIYESASVDIIGGTFGALHAFDYSAVYMTAGEGNRIWSHDSSTVDLYGGTIDVLAGFDDAEITMFVESYTIEMDPFLGYDARLTGSWFYFPGTFNILVREGSLSYITVEVVPEPATILLIGLGGLILRAC